MKAINSKFLITSHVLKVTQNNIITIIKNMKIIHIFVIIFR